MHGANCLKANGRRPRVATTFADGYAKDGQSIERKFAEDMDLADEVCVYAKLPKGFSVPMPVGNCSKDFRRRMWFMTA